MTPRPGFSSGETTLQPIVLITISVSLLPDALLYHHLITTNTMTSRGVSTLKFVGTVSLGLLTVSDHLPHKATSRHIPAVDARGG